MNPAGVLLVACLAAWAGRLSLYRTVHGQQDELEMCRQHLDVADQRITVRARIARSAIYRGRRLREVTS